MKIDPELKQLIAAGASLLVALADRLNADTKRQGGNLSGCSCKPKTDEPGKSEPEKSSESTTGAQPSSTVPAPTTSDSSETPPPPPPPPEDGTAATPPPPPEAGNSTTPPPPPPDSAPEPVKSGRKITKARAAKINANMVELAQNLGDSGPLRAKLLEFGVKTPADFHKDDADTFEKWLKEQSE